MAIGRTDFTDDDDNLLVKFIATYNPESGGRSGNVLYKRLAENADSKWSWSTRHSWQSWRNRYVKNQEWFDWAIKRYIKKKAAKKTASRNDGDDRTEQKKKKRKSTSDATTAPDVPEEQELLANAKESRSDAREGSDLSKETTKARKPQGPAAIKRRPAVESDHTDESRGFESPKKRKRTSDATAAPEAKRNKTREPEHASGDSGIKEASKPQNMIAPKPDDKGEGSNRGPGTAQYRDPSNAAPPKAQAATAKAATGPSVLPLHKALPTLQNGKDKALGIRDRPPHYASDANIGMDNPAKGASFKDGSTSTADLTEEDEVMNTLTDAMEVPGDAEIESLNADTPVQKIYPDIRNLTRRGQKEQNKVMPGTLIASKAASPSKPLLVNAPKVPAKPNDGGVHLRGASPSPKLRPVPKKRKRPAHEDGDSGFFGSGSHSSPSPPAPPADKEKKKAPPKFMEGPFRTTLVEGSRAHAKPSWPPKRPSRQERDERRAAAQVGQKSSVPLPPAPAEPPVRQPTPPQKNVQQRVLTDRRAILFDRAHQSAPFPAKDRSPPPKKRRKIDEIIVDSQPLEGDDLFGSQLLLSHSQGDENTQAGHPFDTANPQKHGTKSDKPQPLDFSALPFRSAGIDANDDYDENGEEEDFSAPVPMEDSPLYLRQQQQRRRLPPAPSRLREETLPLPQPHVPAPPVDRKGKGKEKEVQGDEKLVEPKAKQSVRKSFPKTPRLDLRKIASCRRQQRSLVHRPPGSDPRFFFPDSGKADPPWLDRTLADMAACYGFSAEVAKTAWKEMRDLAEVDALLNRMKEESSRIAEEHIERVWKKRESEGRMSSGQTSRLSVAQTKSSGSASHSRQPSAATSLPEPPVASSSKVTLGKALPVPAVKATIKPDSSPEVTFTPRPIVDSEDDRESEYEPPRHSRAGRIVRLSRHGRLTEALQREQRRASGHTGTPFRMREWDEEVDELVRNAIPDKKDEMEKVFKDMSGEVVIRRVADFFGELARESLGSEQEA